MLAAERRPDPMSSDEQRRQAVLGRIRTVRRRLNLEVLFAHAIGPAWVAATVFVLWRVFVQRWVPVAGGVAVLGALVALRASPARIGSAPRRPPSSRTGRPARAGCS